MALLERTIDKAKALVEQYKAGADKKEWLEAYVIYCDRYKLIVKPALSESQRQELDKWHKKVLVCRENVHNGIAYSKPQSQPVETKEIHYTTFPPLADNSLVSRPNGFTDEALFIYTIRFLTQKGCDLSPRQHNQWAGILFKWENNVNRLAKMSRIKQAYSIYFTEGKYTYTFDVDKIVHHFPDLFDLPQQESTPDTNSSLVEQLLAMQKALDNEIKESRRPKNLESYIVEDLVEQKLRTKDYIYIASIKTNAGSDPHFREGLRVNLKIDGYSHFCETIDYDYENGLLYVTSPSELRWNNYSRIYVVVDNSFIIEGLQKRLIQIAQQAIDPALPIYKFLEGTTEDLSDVPHNKLVEVCNQSLDDSQMKAYKAALSKDITFIWGPPGTGKSFTLASIIRALYQLGDERTAVCCVSNVAVDQLVNKVVDILEEEGNRIEPGNFYRAGHTIDERILATDFLFPDDEITKSLRKEIQLKKATLEQIAPRGMKQLSPQAIQYKADIKDIRQRLQDRTDWLVQKSRVVFSTISNFVLSEKIHQSQFDNLIVDEASMLAFPSLLALAGKISKRIILVGDFQQLSPIALVPDHWLNDNVFKLCGIDINHTSHPALHQLLNQRRSHRKIVDVINETFYDKKLNATIDKESDVLLDSPYPDRVIKMVHVADGRMRFTKGGTRQNKPSAEKVMEVLDAFYTNAHRDFSIGIITPYKGQANLLRALKAERNYSTSFSDRLHIGTVHTFQGLECDVIIYDIVDCQYTENGHTASIGKIYAGMEGEQLINVAVSRARHQLIVVGDAAYMDRSVGKNLSGKTLRIFRKLNNYQG